jgi:TolB-like protein/Flp pilus assembly protein TadD
MQPRPAERPWRFRASDGSEPDFELYLTTRELRKDGDPIDLQDQPFHVLSMLVQARGRLVNREEIVERLWPGYVAFPIDGLNKAIEKVRDALNDSANNPRFVETLPRRGYRFIAVVIPPDQQASSISTPSAIPSLAVLPFQNLCSDAVAQDYFVDGMTETLICTFGQIRGWRVIALFSAKEYKDSRKTVTEIARELHVDYVVTGSVNRSGDYVRITAKLIQVATGTQLWSKMFEPDIQNIWALQSEVALSIANAVRIQLSPEENTRLKQPRMVKPEALEWYLTGRYFWNRRTEPALTKAVECFRKAIHEEPEYAEAHAGIADCYNMLAWNSMLPPKVALPKARAAALEARKIDDQLAEAHASLAFDLLFQDWNWRGAEEEFRRAIELNPSYVVGRPWLAFELSALGREREACVEAQRAVQLDPVGAPILVSAALVYYLGRQCDKAIKLCEQILDIHPDSFYQGYFILGMAREGKGLHAEAIESLKTCVSKSDRNPHMLAALGYVLARSGRTAEAIRVIEELKDRLAHSYGTPFNIAMVYAGLSQKEETLEWLETAYEDHSMWLIFVNTYPIFDFLRPDPRFKDLVRRMGFTS